MRQLTSATDARRGERMLRFTFVSAVVSLVAVFAGVGSTIPLFNIYRAENGFTNADISLTAVAYSAATLGTLLVLGRLSNHVGRRPVTIASLGLLMLGCLLLLNVQDIGILIAGRLLMGIGAGLASNSLTAYIVDAAPVKPAWLASAASSHTVMLGLAVGAIASGALVQFGPWPRQLPYLIVVGMLALSAALIALSSETVTAAPAGWQSLRPRVRVPARVKRLLPVAAALTTASNPDAGTIRRLNEPNRQTPPRRWHRRLSGRTRPPTAPHRRRARCQGRRPRRKAAMKAPGALGVLDELTFAGEDVWRIARLARWALDERPATTSELLMAIVDRRYASGVRLRNATGDMPGAQAGSHWLFTDRDGAAPGWRTNTSWRDVKVAARVLGRGGLTLFATGGRDVATFLHNGCDNTIRVFQADLNGHLEMTDLADYTRTHSFPAAIAAIDRSGEVHA